MVTKTDRNTVVIERFDRSVEKVSRWRVVLAPKPKTEEEVKEILRPEHLPVDGRPKQKPSTFKKLAERLPQPNHPSPQLMINNQQGMPHPKSKPRKAETKRRSS